MNNDALYGHPLVKKSLLKYIRRSLPALAKEHGASFVHEILPHVNPHDLPKILQQITRWTDGLLLDLLDIKKNQEAIVFMISPALIRSNNPEIIQKIETVAPWCFIENVHADLDKKLSLARNRPINSVEDLENYWSPLIDHFDIKEYQEKFNQLHSKTDPFKELCAVSNRRRLPLSPIIVGAWWNEIIQKQYAVPLLLSRSGPPYLHYGWEFYRTPLYILAEIEPFVDYTQFSYLEFEQMTKELASRFLYRMCGPKSGESPLSTSMRKENICTILQKRDLMTESEIADIIKLNYAAQELAR